MVLFSDPSVGIADPLLARAFSLAERGRGTTNPNPLVGCVIARGQDVLGEGFHERAGGPHAEVVALKAAGDSARGAHAYVTLEPCTHTGRTPPCVDRLLACGIAEVTVGMADPNTAVSGGGARVLAAAGVRVLWAADPEPFERQNEAWLKRLRTGLPFVRVKVALTLDGKGALHEGQRARITGDGGREVTMRLRSRANAVVVGARTVGVDDPVLTVRVAGGATAERQPLRVVLGRDDVPDPTARVFSDGAGPALVLVSDAADVLVAEERLADRGVRLVRYPENDGILGAFRALAAEGVDDVLVEAGPALLGALWAEGAIDELIVVSAGGMGGASALGPLIGHADEKDGDLVPRMAAVECAVAGRDAVSVWRPLEVSEC